MKRIIKNLLLLGVASAMVTACGYCTGAMVKGEFSVAQGKKVYFSQGNLQYQASTGIWRFAEHQWDMIGEDNKYISPNYDGWIDLFGWGTSGYKGKYPYMTSNETTDYGDGKNDIAGTKYDWGVYNKISNGGSKAGLWRTLTNEEWSYLLQGRPHCEDLHSVGRVNGINGLILLPDEWNHSIDFIPKAKKYETNDYTLEEWETMEANGAVFLPAAGVDGIRGTYVQNVGALGCYWSSSAVGYYGENFLQFFYWDAWMTHDGCRNAGQSVRLVQDVK